jgi:DNA-binding NarL/FixJ family response regulator
MADAGNRIRVLVAEDNADLCEAVCALIAAEPDMEVAASSSVARGLLESVHSSGARCVVLDLNLSGESSVPVLRALRSGRSGIGVVVFSGYDRSDVAAALPISPACQFVSKTGDTLALLDAIRQVTLAAAADDGQSRGPPPSTGR